MANFILTDNIVHIQNGDQSTPVQALLDAACSGLPYAMQVQTSRQGNKYIGMPDEVFQRGNNDNEKAFQVALAHVRSFQALKDHGVSEFIQFRTMSRDRQSRQYKPANLIYMRNIEGIPNSFRDSRGQRATESELTTWSTKYYELGGLEAPPPNLPEPAMVGWYKAKAVALQQAAVTETIAQAEDASSDDAPDVADL